MSSMTGQSLEGRTETGGPDRTPRSGILGHGAKAKAAYDMYKRAADENQAADKFGKRHVHVVLWDGVTNPAEIAEDLILLAA